MVIKLNRERIEQNLKTDFLARSLRVLDEIDSTQSYLFDNLNEFPDGAVIIAESQSAGYGRMGRVWHSPYGEGVYMSILFKHIPPSPMAQFTLLGSLSLTGYLKIKYGFDFKLKWPNDVLIGENKIAGVLAEVKNGIAGLGFGINVNNNFNELPQRATSLSLLTGETMDRDILIAEFLNHFEQDYKRWQKSPYGYLRELWINFALLRGKDVTVYVQNGTIKGTVEDITENCGLIIRTDMGFKTELLLNELIKIG
ncbi:MAG TPA: biotin--[acetyl-CoA-carboxylase] ligase [Candidatus Omnitrophica bacterium]|nr:biotin--[acetyl-CoA-carboxylase] ligase [Candidatus Omnitrophota bacterium]